MKKTFTKILSNPKTFIPVFAVVVLMGSVFLYRDIGKAPVVPQNIAVSTTQPVLSSGNNISLSFPKSGRVDAVLVKNGDVVKAGQVLAQLSAPDAAGAVKQAKGALDLARAQYASLNTEYATTKKQQDLLVSNAYRTLVSSGLEGTPDRQDPNVPIISGTYTCGKEGAYILKPYASSDNDSGYSFKYSGLESGVASVKYDNPVPLGTCGLQIKFTHVSNFNSITIWTIDIPNTKSSVYLENKNDYEVAVNTREKILTDLANKIGAGTTNSVAQAQINAAEGTYQAALGAYQNNVIISPVNGTVNFVDPDLKVGQSVNSGKSVISITQ